MERWEERWEERWDVMVDSIGTGLQMTSLPLWTDACAMRASIIPKPTYTIW